MLSNEEHFYPLSDYVHNYKLGRNALLDDKILQRKGHVPFSLAFIKNNRQLFPHISDSVLFPKDRMKVYYAERLIGQATVDVLRLFPDNPEVVELALYMEMENDVSCIFFFFVLWGGFFFFGFFVIFLFSDFFVGFLFV